MDSFEGDMDFGSAQDNSVSGSRLARIHRLRQAIAAGSYNVPASAVAARVVDQMLLDKTPRGELGRLHRIEG